jgi:prepilin-type N-terminal cleavage/methylation domain-containing protein
VLTALRRLRGRRNDDGMTLMEMVVGIAIASVLAALVTNWFIGASDASTAATDSTVATAGARNVLQSWTQDLQLAGSPTTPGAGTGRIVSVTPTAIDFYANLNNASCTSNTSCAALSTTEVKLSLTGGNLVEKLGSATTSVAVPGNYTTAGACLFTPLVNGTPIMSNGAPMCSGLTPAQLDGVTGISLAFTLTPKSGHPRSYTTTASFTTYPTIAGGASSAPLS